MSGLSGSAGGDREEIQGEGEIKEVGPGLAVRANSDGGRPPANWCTLDYESVRGIAETNTIGDLRYGVDNWAKGIPASNLLNHAMEHLFKLLNGDSIENHIEHAMWNLGKLRWMARNKPEMIDLPRVRKALGLPLLEGTLIPADPNPDRNTNCWFCGRRLAGYDFKVIPPKNRYRQAHVYCFKEADKVKQQEFAEPL